VPRRSWPIGPVDSDPQASSEAVRAVWRHVIRKERAQVLQELLAAEEAAKEVQCESTLAALPTAR